MPVLDAARTLKARGDQVVLLVPPSLASAARAGGFEVVVGGQPPDACVEEIWQRVRDGPPEQVAGLIDRELFAGWGVDAMLQPARGLRDQFRPDLVMRESCEYATAIAAHEHGVAQAQIAISQAMIEATVLEHVATRLESLSVGVTRSIQDAPYLTAFPASLDPSCWRDTRRYRVSPASVEELPDWWKGTDDLPLVYITFGSVLGARPEALSVYRAALESISGLQVRALMTVGPAFDRDTLGPVPTNAHVEDWVDHANAFAAADMVLCHGGSGTTYGALAASRPLVICPLFADQMANAETIQRVGAGIVVRSPTRARGDVSSLGSGDVPDLRRAIMTVLRTPAFQQASRRIAEEIASAQTLGRVVDHLSAAVSQ